jgi:hypothetical protein
MMVSGILMHTGEPIESLRLYKDARRRELPIPMLRVAPKI